LGGYKYLAGTCELVTQPVSESITATGPSFNDLSFDIIAVLGYVTLQLPRGSLSLDLQPQA
jgi:hypothetical protein